ncbi:hypothetical protein L0F63_002426 [Massospora cicadina]|nr:hypothetical protein L0F63_002426 [Massospora cicadina]
MEFPTTAPTIFLQRDRQANAYTQHAKTTGPGEPGWPAFIKFEVAVEASVEDAASAGEAQDGMFRDKIRTYEVRIKQTPHDIDLWLEYIQFQAREEELRGKNRHSTRSIKNEIQIAMFERALQANPECVELGSDAFEWDQILTQPPKNLTLWLQYINYRLTEFSAFNVNAAVDIFAHCLRMIGTDTVQAEKDTICIIDRFCRFLRDTGFSEWAIGIYQALMEWTFYCPPAHLHHSDRLSSFKTFWLKEWPRFGEAGATGWDSYDRLEVIPYFHPLPSSDGRGTQLSERLTLEQSLDFDEHLPISSSRIGDSPHLDPHRVVLFEDVAPYLINLSCDESKRELVASFIRFAVMPNYGAGSTLTTAVDPFLHTDLGLRPSLERFFPKHSAFESYRETLGLVHGMYMAAEPPLAQAQESIFVAPFRHFPHNGEDLFRAAFVLNGLNPRIGCPQYYQFVCNSMRELSAIALKFEPPSVDPTLVYLSASATMDPTNTEAKFFDALKRSPTSLALYGAYAAHHFQDKNYGEAHKVFSASIDNFWASPSSFAIHITSIYRLWADLELRAGNLALVKAILVAYVFKGRVNFEGTGFLYFQEPCPEMVANAAEIFASNPVAPNLHPKDPVFEPTFAHIHLHAIFQYVLEGIAAGCRVYDRALGYFKSGSGCRGSHELFTYVSLLQVYVKAGTGFKPGIVRRVLEEALAQFPSNTVLLEAYRQLESHFRYARRLRNFVARRLHHAPSLPLWFFAIFAELHLPPGQGSVQFTRTLFERAVECPTASGCSALWALFITFEIRLREYAAATSLLFRAIHACPASKDLCTLGLVQLRSHLSEGQMEELIHLMMENNLRIRALG